MTKHSDTVEAAWISNAEEISRELRSGKIAVFLTLGDPTTYSTFGYILKKMAIVMPDADIETIPGITSFHAAAARLNRILVEGEESLLITSGAYGGDRIRKAGSVENIAIVKAYKNINGVAVSKCGRNHETIINNLDDLETRDPDYWTLILASK